MFRTRNLRREQTWKLTACYPEMYNRRPTSGKSKYGKLTAGRMVSVPTTEEGGLGDIKDGQERVWALGLPSIPRRPLSSFLPPSSLYALRFWTLSLAW